MKIEGSARVWVIVLVAVVEAVFIAHLWQASKPKVELGFLLKVGQSYLVAWRDTNEVYETRVFSNLDAARRLVKSLKLSLGHRGDLELEYLSLNDRFGGFVLHWKVFGEGQQLNQLTFESMSDAQFFGEAIRKGAYTPSPFGHSIFLSPTRAAIR